jgi:hypothetical protein
MTEQEKKEIRAEIARLKAIIDDPDNFGNPDRANWIQKLNNLKANLK